MELIYFIDELREINECFLNKNKTLQICTRIKNGNKKVSFSLVSGVIDFINRAQCDSVSMKNSEKVILTHRSGSQSIARVRRAAKRCFGLNEGKLKSHPDASVRLTLSKMWG
ncbi:hypothetical protein [Pseudoalteromonas xiamenensis]